MNVKSVDFWLFAWRWFCEAATVCMWYWIITCMWPVCVISTVSTTLWTRLHFLYPRPAHMRNMMLTAGSVSTETPPPSSAFLFHTFAFTNVYALSLPSLSESPSSSLLLIATFHLKETFSFVLPRCRSVHHLHLPFTSSAELQSRDQGRKSF